MEILLSILGGLGLFLFAVTRLGEVMNELLEAHSRKMLRNFVKNIFTALLTGIVITVLLDSSSPRLSYSLSCLSMPGYLLFVTP